MTVTVRLDGATVVPVARTVLADPGRHELRVTRGDVVVATRNATLVAQEPAQIVLVQVPATDAALRPTTRDAGRTQEQRSPDVAPWIAVGVGGVALAGATVTSIIRANALGDLDAACGDARASCPESKRSTFQRADTMTTATNVFLVTGVVAAVAATVLWLTAR